MIYNTNIKRRYKASFKGKKKDSWVKSSSINLNATSSTINNKPISLSLRDNEQKKEAQQEKETNSSIENWLPRDNRIISRARRADLEFLTDCWNRSTIVKRVAGETGCATANRRVIDNLTLWVRAASARTRIDALLIDASLIRWAIRADNAFGPAIGARANHVGHTAALGLSANNLTLRIGSARCRSARIGW